jgi:hypothetical protein
MLLMEKQGQVQLFDENHRNQLHGYLFFAAMTNDE